MNLSVKDRKILWAKAHNRCSYRFDGEVCPKRLATAVQGCDVVVGEECHIVGEKPGSARYLEDYADRDTYDNAVLLCSVHHKIVDDRSDVYTVKLLRRMKVEHEAAVASDAAGPHVEIRNSEFVTEAKHADRAVGMEIDRPASFTNVRSTLKATDVREVIGFKATGGITLTLDSCPK